MEKLTHDTYKYIYDPHWANYLVIHGAKVTGVGLNKRSNRVYIAFDYNSTQKIYEEYYKNKKA